jgi:type IV pilus assembly protein PilA
VAIRSGEHEQDGFTLIELMVVVLILAILLAIAIPTFLGARTRANSRAAQSDLRNALTGEQTLYSANQLFSQDTVTALPAIEAGIQWTTPPAVDPKSVAVLTDATDQSVVLQANGRDGNCYAVYQTNSSYGSQTAYMETPGKCLSLSMPNNAPDPQTPVTASASLNLGQWSRGW